MMRMRARSRKVARDRVTPGPVAASEQNRGSMHHPRAEHRPAGGLRRRLGYRPARDRDPARYEVPGAILRGVHGNLCEGGDKYTPLGGYVGTWEYFNSISASTLIFIGKFSQDYNLFERKIIFPGGVISRRFFTVKIRYLGVFFLYGGGVFRGFPGHRGIAK